MANLFAYEKTQIQYAARTFFDRAIVADLRLALHEDLMAGGGFRDAAWYESAERFVAIEETWAREIGALFAQTVRTAFRDAERAIRDEKSAAVRFAEEARQAASEAGA